MNSTKLATVRRRVEMCRKATEHTLRELENIQRLLDDVGMTDDPRPRRVKDKPMTEADVIQLLNDVLGTRPEPKQRVRKT